MKYEKVSIVLYNYDKDFKLCCYTFDGINFIIIKYIYTF